jgi:membrane protease YdiL (CAAX protease family)
VVGDTPLDGLPPDDTLPDDTRTDGTWTADAATAEAATAGVPTNAAAPDVAPIARRRSTFDLQGRAAPGLYLAAWALAVAGLGSIFIAIASGGAGGSAVAFVLGIAGLGLGLTAGAGSQALQRRADGAIYPGPSPVLVFLAALALTLVAGFVLVALDVVPEAPASVLVSVLIQAAISVGLIALVVVSPDSLSWREMGFRLPRAGEGSVVADVAWGVALAVPTLFGTLLLAAVLVAILGVAPESPLPPSTDPAGVLVNLLAAAVIAPLWEELFFRGFTTTAWQRSAGARAAIVRGAIFFALVHVITLVGSDFGTAVRTALIAFAIRLPVGLVLGWVFLRRRTLVAPIALHAAYNVIPVLLVALSMGSTPS